VENHYQPNATLITFERVTTGRDALLALFVIDTITTSYSVVVLERRSEESAST